VTLPLATRSLVSLLLKLNGASIKILKLRIIKKWKFSTNSSIIYWAEV